MTYLVRHTHIPSDPTKPQHMTYWYGPKHGWGTTSGPLHDGEVAAFPNRLSAERALRSVFGSYAAAKRRGYEVITDRREAS